MAGNFLRALCVILIGGSVLAGTPVRAADAPQKIRFAYASRSNIVTPKHLAQSRGFFRAEGLEVEMIQMNPRLSATAIINSIRSRVGPGANVSPCTGANHRPVIC